MAELNFNLEHGRHLSVIFISLMVGLLLIVCVKGLKYILNSDLKHGVNLKISSRMLFTVFVALLCFTTIEVILHLGRSPVVIDSLSQSYTPVRSAIQSVRLQQMNNGCIKGADYRSISEIMSSLKKTMIHILVDDYHKALYCYIPKTGCTLWKGLLMNMSRLAANQSVKGYVHDTKKMKKYGIRELKTYKTEEIIFRLHTYYKFLYVRHPFTRLVSAFRDKFTGKKDAFFAYLPKMLKYTRKLNKTIFANETQKYNFTFTEFLEYSFQSPDTSFRFNEHWDKIESLCSPCFIDYDYVGKQETLHKDTRDILKNMFKRNMSEIAVPNWTGSDESKAKMYFREVPERLKTKVVEYYSRDAEMFGYDLRDY